MRLKLALLELLCATNELKFINYFCDAEQLIG